MSQLIVEPESRRFVAAEAAAFADAVRDQDACSVLQPVRHEEDVLLDDEGQTAGGGHRYTGWALFQLCQAVCPGLYRLITDYAGCERGADAPRLDYSFAEAVDVLNRLVRRRFRTRVAGRQMLRNSRTGVIDGLVGGGYRWLPNRTLFEQAVDAFAQHETAPRFFEAELSGRRMLVRYIHPRTYCELEGSGGGRDRFVRGYHVSNDEVGRAAARIGSILVREQGLTCALQTVSAGRVPHRGNVMQARLRKLFLRLPSQLLGGADVTLARLRRLRAESLGFAGDEARDTLRRADLVTALARRGPARGAALRMLSDAVYRGSYAAEAQAPVRHLPPAEIATRTAFDLYNAIGRYARPRAIPAREQAERVAFAILAGQLVLPALPGE